MPSESAPNSSPLLLTVIIPAFNEVRTIAELLRQVLAAPYHKQVIVVDDGSSDGTIDALAPFREHPQVEVLRHDANRGKGAAIRTGLASARGKYCIVQDADLEYDPQDYRVLVDPLESGRASVVYGSRYLRGRQERWRLFRYGVSALNLAVRILYGVRLTDEATCYKVLPTDLLKALELECERFEFCPEVTAKLCRLGLPILEVAITYRSRTALEGKKIRWTDGVQALATLWRWRHWHGRWPRTST
ncbi:MAG: glycosyltransferase family 2 protein [Planctomycetaceae bacterium]|nr:glycosyltransferase family 2 protein [Planctomycetaceae bacterium]